MKREAGKPGGTGDSADLVGGARAWPPPLEGREDQDEHRAPGPLDCAPHGRRGPSAALRSFTEQESKAQLEEAVTQGMLF